MLKEFAYLGSEKAEEVVITNTNRIADMCEKISPVRPDKCPPVIENSDQMLRDICYNKAHKMYGDPLPEIVQERLEREYDLDLISSAPTVIYEALTKKGDIIYIDSPSKMPDGSTVEDLREPIAECHILVPQEYLGNVMTLCIERRGVQKDMKFLGNQVSITFEIPMAEVVMDFFDKLKSCSRGFASLDYNFVRFESSSLVKVDVLINSEKVDALAMICHRQDARHRGIALVEKMKDLIPRQMYDVAIQAAIGAQIIARSTVKAMRKNVLAKCYGGDVSRKKKLLSKQKEGKKRMKQVGSVEIPQEAFLAVLKVDR